MEKFKAPNKLTEQELEHVVCAALHHESVFDVLRDTTAELFLHHRGPDGVDLAALVGAYKEVTLRPGQDGFVEEVVARTQAFIAQLGLIDEDEKKEKQKQVGVHIKKIKKLKQSYSEKLALAQCQPLIIQGGLYSASMAMNNKDRVPTPDDLRALADKADAAGQVAADVQFLSDAWDGYKTWQENGLGKPLGGLATGDERWDKALDGLKGITILAGNEGCGKTSQALQVVRGVLAQQDDTVAVVVSLDMRREVLIARMVCRQANIPWKLYMKGSGPSGKKKHPFHTKAVHGRICEAEQIIRELGGKRLVVVGSEAGESVTAKSLSRMVEQAKCKSGKQRCLLVVDYLQLLSAQGLEGLDADRFRVDELKRVVSEGRKSGDDFAAVIAISEMRKRLAGVKQVAQDGSDIMGSTRIKYAAEATVLTSLASDEEIAHLYPSIRGLKGPARKKAVDEKRKALRIDGRSIISVGLDKGRDGTERGTWLETFHFNTYRFEECVADVEIPSPPVGKDKSKKKVKK
ncbi:MAG: hypothetical protein C0467_19970 [Planctomycetaceae bacterium]|nr:hypothetical protein [Planctomycetaceae bacterium]